MFSFSSAFMSILEPGDEVRVNKALRYHDTGQNEFAFGFGKAVGATPQPHLMSDADGTHCRR